jgi:hypothetical protein
MRLLASLFLLAALSVGVVVDGTVSRTVEITVYGRPPFWGEVIALRESTVVLGTRTGLSPAEMLNDPGALLVVPQSRIVRITTESNTHPITGMLIGAPAGCLGGLAVGSAIEVEKKPEDTFGCNAHAEHEANQVNGMLIGTGVGLAAGCMLGMATGEKGQVVISPEQRDFSFLRGYARYPADEPESLKKMGR